MATTTRNRHAALRVRIKPTRRVARSLACSSQPRETGSAEPVWFRAARILVVCALGAIGTLIAGLLVYFAVPEAGGEHTAPVTANAVTPAASVAARAANHPLSVSRPKASPDASAVPPSPSAPQAVPKMPHVEPVIENPVEAPPEAPTQLPAITSVPSKTQPPLTEAQLQEQLENVPELLLPAVDTVRGLEIEYAKQRDGNHKRNPVSETRIAGDLQQLWREAKNAGLPFQTGLASCLHPGAAGALARGTVDLHMSPRVLAESGQSCFMTAPIIRSENGQVAILDRKSGRVVETLAGLPRSALLPADGLRRLFEITWPAEKVETTFDVVPVITQVLQPESPAYRELLVEELSRIPGAEAGVALARRALYDTSPEIRKSAIAALKRRPAAEFRNTVLDGFRYPWAPVADHAADVLAGTHDAQAVPKLKEIVAQKDPSLPFLDPKTKQHEVREMVKINHMQNCCLCHAPSYSGADWVPGRVMEPGVPIPPEYYGAPHGAFVRADITFLRQDFSTTQRVINAQPWPEQQRFDYVVRTRRPTLDEMNRLEKQSASGSYPQRDAALRALRELAVTDPAPAQPADQVTDPVR